MSDIIEVKAREILDSRGNPTIEVDVILASGAMGRASVPSGASTGSFEAKELRDGDTRYAGKGVLKAVHVVENEIYPEIMGLSAYDQLAIDKLLIELDGTDDKSCLGANAILGVSMAVAKAAASDGNLPLYKYLGGFNAHRMPLPMINIINGGAHSNNKLDLQEFMIAPVGALDISEAIRMGSEIFHSLGKLLNKGGFSISVGDEGGFAPNLADSHEALDYIIKAIEVAGYTPGKDVLLAIDAATSEVYKDGKYYFKKEGYTVDSDELIRYWEKLINEYPLYSIEDAMSEDDWEGWVNLTAELGDKIQLVGDDVFVTNPHRLIKGISDKVGNAILVKVNQIGTLSETFQTIDIAHRAGYEVVISHRSGETEDTTIADIAVAVNSGQIKVGSISRSDRLAKYNQLIRIEEELNNHAYFSGLEIVSKYKQ